jgi:plastocyanin
LHPSGTPYSPLPNTNTCHDITAYPQIGLAAGACQGNGILLDISDPVNPRRLHEVADANFAYWHSATFNNDGTTVIFTDEWGGGTAAADGSVAVEIEAGQFAGAPYEIPAGETVTFAVHNKDPWVHTFTIPALGVDELLRPAPLPRRHLGRYSGTAPSGSAETGD